MWSDTPSDLIALLSRRFRGAGKRHEGGRPREGEGNGCGGGAIGAFCRRSLSVELRRSDHCLSLCATLSQTATTRRRFLARVLLSSSKKKAAQILPEAERAREGRREDR